MLRQYGAWFVWIGLLAPWPAPAEPTTVDRGSSVERHLSTESTPIPWALDPDVLESQRGDRIEERTVQVDAIETVKLRNVIPPIRFPSGVADIPASYIERLRHILDSVGHLDNVRLHLVGHADDQPLSAGLAGVYGDNRGLSRERASEVAEFIQSTLSLPPEAISFAWAGDSQPIATNDSEAGRALNRRVEVEVWYDVTSKKPGTEEVVASEEFRRIKVCRMETVCKLRYREGHDRRARVRNLVAPLRLGDDSVGVPAAFLEQVRATLQNLGDRRSVIVKLLGFTDDGPLPEREERIYGTHLALSKARAYRVARALQESLGLASSAIVSEGRGSSQPVASNATERGRRLNRRVEVEFWYDDPLQELPDEPQPCPDADEDERVTRVYEPPWGSLEALRLESGEALIPPGYADALRRAMADLEGRTNVRLRFVGYTANERLQRRTALAYGDDVGLSTARARRAMEVIAEALELEESQSEHEGRGFVQANDVVNGGFLQGAESFVEVQVVYDDLAPLDDYEGVEITPITREIRPKHPLALNPLRITVEGEPVHDLGRSSADVQRCTDVALERADIRFRYEGQPAERRLSVTAHPTSFVLPSPSGLKASDPSVVQFQSYANYAHFIERSEIRIFERDRSVRSEPLDVVAVDASGRARWQPSPGRLPEPVRELTYVLRAYDDRGRFDETSPRPLWIARPDAHPSGTHPSSGTPPSSDPSATGDGTRIDPETGLPDAAEATDARGLLAGYGENDLALQNIPLGSVGSVSVHGNGIPPGHQVWLAGSPVPLDARGAFVADAILPKGTHTVEVAVLDEEGAGELFLRDLELGRSEWFYVGLADLTLSERGSSGPVDALTGANAPDLDSAVDGRLAFFTTGSFGEAWRLTASADTREGPVQDLFSNFMDKSPEALFRRIDPDYHYPTFGDDGTVQELAPTSGKFFARLGHRDSHALWGNFRVGYLSNELAHVERGLYGANLRYQSDATTPSGEKRVRLDGFAAEPGTVPSREEFRATGGSLYFLKRQDLLVGSERVRVEVRDKDSGLVTAVEPLKAGLDYDLDYLQGRLLLSEPLASTADDDLLVRTGGLSGDEVWLVVQYEFTPGFEEPDVLATGARGEYWLNDHVRLGLTTSRGSSGDEDGALHASDLILRKSEESWLKLQTGLSRGRAATSLLSNDGGFEFVDPAATALGDVDAAAYRADLNLGLADWFPGAKGRASLYAQSVEAGYSAPGLTALTDTNQFGGSFRTPVTDSLELVGKGDRSVQDDGLAATTGEVDVGYRLSDRWTLSTGVRYDDRDDRSQGALPTTPELGKRADAVLQLLFDSGARWRSYGFGQTTLFTDGDREDNGSFGIGGDYRLNDRLRLDAEVSHGDLGPGAALGASYQLFERTRVYLNYGLDNERTEHGLRENRSNLVAGARTRLSDSASVYVENRRESSDSSTGLTRAMGLTLAPADRWSVGAGWDSGTIVDRLNGAETERNARSLKLGYGGEALRFSSGVEHRLDDTESTDGTSSERTTWLFRNTLRYQPSPSWRVLGKLNHSFSESSQGQLYDGGYTEAELGGAYRPIHHDRLNLLAKYTYFYNVPSPDQITLQNTSSEYVQKSHVGALDVTYDLTRSWSIGGKYAYRLGQLSLDRVDPEFFDNNAHLFILRTDWRFRRNWEALLEARVLDLSDLGERRSGALVSVYRYLGDHFKVGVGYNFTDFSDDLTDLSYDHRGFFVNVVATM